MGCVLTVVCFLGIWWWISSSLRVRKVAYARYERAVHSLTGHSETEARQAMTGLGMVNCLTINGESDWRDAADHVSPTPPSRRGRRTLRFTDNAALTRKCTFLYLDKNGTVREVFLTVEFW